MALAVSSTSLRNGKVLKRYSDTSASGAALTVTTTGVLPERLLFATANYSANATVSVTLGVDSGLGATYDCVLITTALTAAQEASMIPNHPDITIEEDDNFYCTAPLLASETVTVVIYTIEESI
mgnify:CR=1 FL=1